MDTTGQNETLLVPVANPDLTILGATRDPFLKRKLVGSIAEGVGRTAANSVILTRKVPRDEDA